MFLLYSFKYSSHASVFTVALILVHNISLFLVLPAIIWSWLCCTQNVGRGRACFPVLDPYRDLLYNAPHFLMWFKINTIWEMGLYFWHIVSIVQSSATNKRHTGGKPAHLLLGNLNVCLTWPRYDKLLSGSLSATAQMSLWCPCCLQWIGCRV